MEIRNANMITFASSCRDMMFDGFPKSHFQIAIAVVEITQAMNTPRKNVTNLPWTVFSDVGRGRELGGESDFSSGS